MARIIAVFFLLGVALSDTVAGMLFRGAMVAPFYFGGLVSHESALRFAAY